MATTNTEVKNIIVIGASAGGLTAVTKLFANFTTDMDAAFFVVIHLSPISKSDAIIKIIDNNTALKCLVPVDGQQIENGTIYLAPANRHLLLEKGKIHITRGAGENHYRPSIDVLFRSAAAAYSACVIGIVLTGLLDDGTSGMDAIKRSGGKCIVQEPEEALFDDMPISVMNNIDVDYSLPIAEIKNVLIDLITGPVCVEKEVPADVRLEAKIAKRVTSDIDETSKLGDFTALTCPECGGVMVKVDENQSRYRCYTGHTFTERFLETEQLKRIEESVWVSIRMMEERKHLLLNMNSDINSRFDLDAARKDERIKSMQKHIDTLRSALLTLDPDRD